jgi:hypothetical protein
MDENEERGILVETRFKRDKRVEELDQINSEEIRI